VEILTDRGLVPAVGEAELAAELPAAAFAAAAFLWGERMPTVAVVVAAAATATGALLPADANAAAAESGATTALDRRRIVMPGNGAAAQVEATAAPSAFWEAPAEGERAGGGGARITRTRRTTLTAPTRAPLAPARHHGQIDDVI
jgi:hypothetical protein